MKFVHCASLLVFNMKYFKSKCLEQKLERKNTPKKLELIKLKHVFFIIKSYINLLKIAQKLGCHRLEVVSEGVVGVVT